MFSDSVEIEIDLKNLRFNLTIDDSVTLAMGLLIASVAFVFVSIPFVLR